MRVGIACINTSTTCAPGGTLHDAWTAIYRSIVTIDDPVSPTASGAGGSLLAGGYLRGNATASLGSASDSTGIRAVQVRVDGDRVVGETQLACDYTRRARAAMSRLRSRSRSSPRTSGTEPGRAQIGAVDAGGNFTAAVDPDDHRRQQRSGRAPGHVAHVRDDLRHDRDDLVDRAPEPGLADHDGPRDRLQGGGGCRTSTQAAGSGRGSRPSQLPDGPGRYTATVSLSDAAGNHIAYNAAHWSVTLAGSLATVIPTPTPPTPSTPTSAGLRLATPTVAKDRRTIRVRGTTAQNTRGRVRLTLKARIAGRVRTTTKQATVTNRRYAATLRLPSRRWRTATLTARHGGTTITRTIRNR